MSRETASTAEFRGKGSQTQAGLSGQEAMASKDLPGPVIRMRPTAKMAMEQGRRASRTVMRRGGSHGYVAEGAGVGFIATSWEEAIDGAMCIGEGNRGRHARTNIS